MDRNNPAAWLRLRAGRDPRQRKARGRRPVWLVRGMREARDERQRPLRSACYALLECPLSTGAQGRPECRARVRRARFCLVLDRPGRTAQVHRARQRCQFNLAAQESQSILRRERVKCGASAHADNVCALCPSAPLTNCYAFVERRAGPASRRAQSHVPSARTCRRPARPRWRSPSRIAAPYRRPVYRRPRTEPVNRP